jgi:hypothetical protein
LWGEAVVPRAELRAAVATVGELVPFVDEDDDASPSPGPSSSGIRCISVSTGAPSAVAPTR